MTIHQRRIKLIEFTLDGVSFECGLKSWKIDLGEEDGDRIYSMCPDGEDVEETDPDPTLDLTWWSDWRSNGISDFLWTNRGQTVAFQLDHHPDIPTEHVRWTGNVKLKAPPAGGEARETEMTEITLQIIGTPTYARV